MADVTGIRKILFNVSILYIKKTELTYHLKEGGGEK